MKCDNNLTPEERKIVEQADMEILGEPFEDHMTEQRLMIGGAFIFLVGCGFLLYKMGFLW